MANLDQAIERTRRYAAFFGLPLTQTALCRYLISGKVYSQRQLEKYFVPLTSSQTRLLQTRQRVSRRKIELALSTARLLSRLPTISLIALTGSLAVENARRDDDIDIMIIVAPQTLWITRPLVILLLQLLDLRRPTSLGEHHSLAVVDKICDNLWLDETALAVPRSKRDLYTAHEILQTRPLFDRGGVYRRFILANSWTSRFLANAYAYTTAMIEKDRTSAGHSLAWSNHLTAFFNKLAFKFQYLYMRRKITNETISFHSAYFHPRRLGRELDQYLEQGK